MAGWPGRWKCDDAGRKGPGSAVFAEVLYALNTIVTQDGGSLGDALCYCEPTVMTLLAIHRDRVDVGVVLQLWGSGMGAVSEAAAYLYGLGHGPWHHPACLVALAARDEPGRVHPDRLKGWATGVDINKTEINDDGIEAPVWWAAASRVFSSPEHLDRVTAAFPELDLHAASADGRTVNHHLAVVGYRVGAFLADLINAPDDNGNTPIEVAIDCQNGGVAERMLELLGDQVEISALCVRMLLCARSTGGVKNELLEQRVYFDAEEIPVCTEPHPRMEDIENTAGWSQWFRAVASGDEDEVEKQVAKGHLPGPTDRRRVMEARKAGGFPQAPFFLFDAHEGVGYRPGLHSVTRAYIDRFLPDVKSWWTIHGHRLFEDDVRERARTIMLVEHRMNFNLGGFKLPRLPVELWIIILTLVRVE